MNKHTRGSALAVVLALSLALLATGCAGSSPSGEGSSQSGEGGAESIATGTTSAPTLEQARKAGAISGAIEKEPGRVTEILAENGLSAESLESLILDIAKDPALAEAYEEARAAAAK